MTDSEALKRAARRVDVAIHLAAVADVGDVVASPDRAQRCNAQGTLEVLEAAREAGLERVIYGNAHGHYEEHIPQIEAYLAKENA